MQSLPLGNETQEGILFVSFCGFLSVRGGVTGIKEHLRRNVPAATGMAPGEDIISAEHTPQSTSCFVYLRDR